MDQNTQQKKQGSELPEPTTSNQDKLFLSPPSILNAREAKKVFRHEVLGYYGLNSFACEGKKNSLRRV